MEDSKLKAILWHQGKNDSHSGKYKNYYQKLDLMIKAFREESSTGAISFIMGNLGDYLGKSVFGVNYVEDELINQEFYKKNAERNENCYYVTQKNMYSNPDGIHINTEFQRRLGV